jgi:hypothetical protein
MHTNPSQGREEIHSLDKLKEPKSPNVAEGYNSDQARGGVQMNPKETKHRQTTFNWQPRSQSQLAW